MKPILKITSSIILAITTSTSYAQTCNPNIQTTRPDSRYQDMGAEVKDTVTGLIWQRCSVGQMWNGSTCTGTATTHTWQQALTVAKNLGNGYRLPNIKELHSLVEVKCFEPAINTKQFPNTPTNKWYWSSSPYLHDSKLVWSAKFDTGELSYGYSYKYIDVNYYNSNFVRAVRSE